MLWFTLLLVTVECPAVKRGGAAASAGKISDLPSEEAGPLRARQPDWSDAMASAQPRSGFPNPKAQSANQTRYPLMGQLFGPCLVVSAVEMCSVTFLYHARWEES